MTIEWNSTWATQDIARCPRWGTHGEDFYLAGCMAATMGGFTTKTCTFKVPQTFASVLESWCLQGAEILRLGTTEKQSLSPICQPATISVTYRLPLRFCCGGLVPSRSLISFASAPKVSSKDHPAIDLQPSLSPIGCSSFISSHQT